MSVPASRTALALLLAATVGCTMRRSSPTMMPTEHAAHLHALATEYWDARLEADPVEATLLGDRRWADRLADLSPDANDRQRERLERLLERVRALPATNLGEEDRITHAALATELESDIALRRCFLWQWAVDPRDGPQVLYMNLGHLQTARTPAEGRALLARWAAIPRDLDQRIENLRSGKRAGRVAPAGAVRRVVTQLDDLLGRPTAEWALAEPARTDHPDWPEQELTRLRTELLRTIEEAVRPAFARYRGVLEQEILPVARDDQHVGLGFIPDGAACYARLIRVHTSLELDAQEIHRIGLEEVARVRAELEAVGARVFGTKDLAEIQRRLRSDPALYFGTRDEIEHKAREALARAEAALPRWLGRLPRTPCVVKRIEPFEEKDSTIAYYRQPATDGSRPGTYYVNTYAPNTRPRYEAEALAFHESVPGHHTQIAIAQELAGMPEFRKHLGPTAYVEGWALYTERLADEMGLYGGDLDRIGMLSFDAWRASRLVVDTGLHALGWSRQQAMDYLRDNTALADNNVDNEVDRYIGWPGQALAYKLGQREILRLRAEAERALGPRFDLRAFHDELLGHGAVSLRVLRGLIERWAETGGTTPAH